MNPLLSTLTATSSAPTSSSSLWAFRKWQQGKKERLTGCFYLCSSDLKYVGLNKFPEKNTCLWRVIGTEKLFHIVQAGKYLQVVWKSRHHIGTPIMHCMPLTAKGLRQAYDTYDIRKPVCNTQSNNGCHCKAYIYMVTNNVSANNNFVLGISNFVCVNFFYFFFFSEHVTVTDDGRETK